MLYYFVAQYGIARLLVYVVFFVAQYGIALLLVYVVLFCCAVRYCTAVSICCIILLRSTVVHVC